MIGGRALLPLQSLKMRFVAAVLLFLFAVEASAEKRTGRNTPRQKAAKTPAIAAALKVGTACELKTPVPATIVVEKKRKKTKLAKAARITVTKMGPIVTVATTSGDAKVKKALLVKACLLAAPDATQEALAEQAPLEPVARLETAPPAEPVRPEAQPASVQAEEPVVAAVTAAPSPEANAAAPPMAVESVTVKTQAPARKPGVMRSLAISFTVIGALGIAGGGTLLTLALINNGQLNRRINAYNADPLRPRATFETFAPAAAQVTLLTTIAIIAGAVGVAALTTGIVLFAVDKTPNDVALLKLAPTFAFSSTASHFGLVGQF